MKKKTKRTSINAMLDKKYGIVGSKERAVFSIDSILTCYEDELADIPINEVDTRLEKMQEILLLIKDIRKEAGLTQKELAEKSGMKESYISRIENNKSDIQLSSFFKLLNSLGLNFKLSVG